MSSLDSALKIATNSLGLAQDGITTSSNNIANISTPGYIRQVVQQESVVVAGNGYGAQITGLSASVDSQLLSSIIDGVTSLGYASTKSSYYTSLQNLYGQPNSNNSLSDAINSFFTSYQALSNNPEVPSLRTAAINAATNLATNISTTATGIQKQRLAADKEINNDVATVNTLLDGLVEENAQIINFTENSAGFINIKQQMTSNLNKLAQYINISTSYDDKGKVSISTGNGIALIDDATRSHLEYSPVTSIDSFTSDSDISALTVRVIKQDGTATDTSTELATSGTSSEVTTTLTNGSIYALLQIRDSIAPKLLDQLDTFATALNNEVNAVQNDGFGFPPPSSLTGTTAVKSTDEVDFSGSVRIAVINQDGTPVTSPYSDETYYRPLTIDLSSLDGGEGEGRATIQTIIDQINNYYGPVQNRAIVGNLRNVQLEAVSDSIDDNSGTAQFNLKLDNTSATASTVVIQSVTLIDPSNSGTTYGSSTALPSPNSFTIPAGGMGRTDQPFTVDFSGGTNLSTYTLRVKMQVTDGDGNVSVADVDYSVNDNVSGIKNTQYNASAVTNDSGTSEFITAPGSSTFATASLVDANGDAVSSGTSGYLKITTTDGKSYGIVIDELDSKEIGVPGASSSTVTNRGFSHYFGLNNLFVDTGTSTNSAINMAVRSDIKTNANLLSTGQLTLSNQPSDTTTALYTYEAGSGNNKAALAMADLSQKSVYFSAAGDLPSISITFSGYSADVISSVASSSLQATNTQTSAQTGMDGLQTLFQKQAGVSSDEELSKIIELQNNFSASAQVINIVKQLFDILTQSIK